MRGRTGNDIPRPGLSTGSDTCLQLHASGLGTPKASLAMKRPGLGTGTAGQRQPTPVSVVYSTYCLMRLGQPLPHICLIYPGLLSCATGDRADLPGGLCKGSQRWASLFAGSGKCPEQERVPTSSCWQEKCFHGKPLLLVARDGSLLWTVDPMFHHISLYLLAQLLLTVVVLILLLKQPQNWKSILDWTDLPWDCNRDCKWIRHIKVE